MLLSINHSEVRKLKRIKLISTITLMVGITMISIGLVLQQDKDMKRFNYTKIEEINVKNMAASANMNVQNTSSEEAENLLLKEVKMETAPASVVIPPRVEVYEAMTMEELTDKLNKSLGGILTGHGDIIASHSIEIGVDPYIATAIMLHETGNGTSNIANNCFNFGGQKGYGCGAYKKYGSVEEGLVGMIDNLHKNYYSHGLTTVETIAPRYAESGTWPAKINWYVDQIRTK